MLRQIAQAAEGWLETCRSPAQVALAAGLAQVLATGLEVLLR